MIRKNLPVILLITGVIIAIILVMIFARGGSEAAQTTRPAAIAVTVAPPSMAAIDRLEAHGG